MQMAAADSSTNDANKLQPELQVARCMSNRYKSEDFPRCVACTRRWAGDTCRFQGIRFFLKNEKRQIAGFSFMEKQKADFPNMKFPNEWNVPFTEEHLSVTKVGPFFDGLNLLTKWSEDDCKGVGKCPPSRT